MEYYSKDSFELAFNPQENMHNHEHNMYMYIYKVRFQVFYTE